MNMMLPFKWVSLLAVAGMAPLQAARGQQIAPREPLKQIVMPMEATFRAGPGSKQDEGRGVVVAVENSDVCRVQFKSWTLPDGVRVVISSGQTGESAALTARDLDHWSGFSPLFNGDFLLVEIDDGGTGLSSQIELSAVVSIGAPRNSSLPSYKGICGADDRVRQTAAAVARQWNGPAAQSGLCTSSLIMTGEHFISAGHCGPMEAGSLVEFDPPDSTSEGSVVVAPPEKQFPIDIDSVRRDSDWIQDANGTIMSFGEGDDALAYRVYPNSLGQTPGMARGTYMPIHYTYSHQSDTALLKWGNGVSVPKPSVTNRTMKVVNGFFDGVTRHGSGNCLYSAYSVDQTGGDSGGPVVDLSVGGRAVAVVSYSDKSTCEAAGAYALANASFQIIIQDLFGGPAGNRFVDWRSDPAGLSDFVGSIWNPSPSFGNIDEGLFGGTVYVAPGNYTVTDGVLDSRCTIVAPFGPVTLTH